MCMLWLSWCSGGVGLVTGLQRGIQGVAQSEVMQRGGPAERQAEPGALFSSKFNTVHVEGLIISGDGGQNIPPTKQKRRRHLNLWKKDRLVAITVRCRIWPRKSPSSYRRCGGCMHQEMLLLRSLCCLSAPAPSGGLTQSDCGVTWCPACC